MASYGTAPSIAAVLSPEIRVETISGYQEFLNLKPAWDRLVAEAGIDHPFLEHDWLRTWWDCFGEGNRLHIVVAKAGDHLEAIAPLMWNSGRMWGMPVKRLSFLYNDHVPRAGFIVSPGAPGAYKAIWNHLRDDRSWDLLQLCQLPETSPTLSAVRELAAQDGFPAGVWNSGASPYIRLAGTWEGYLAGLDSKFRANLRNRIKRLGAVGPVKLDVVTSADPDVMDAGFELEAAAWKGTHGTAISCDRRLERFYREFGRRAADRGWLRLNFLAAGNTRINFDYSLAYKNSLYILKSGYDPTHSAYSPNNLMICKLVERAFQEGMDTYYFLGDAVDWKLRWTDTVEHSCWLYVFSNTLAGRLRRTLKFQLSPMLKKILRREAPR
ncbi:MAG: GNAT family N-acetyltransferase [Bryobacterales bacterium]|nr:GNAT family N-acetyltransferase [Bryobacterales bacterium]MBV9401763.1 GNAT family N-acetyltransferase [Bryobacterales bacterium]